MNRPAIAAATGRRGLSTFTKEALWAYLFIAPTLVGIVVFNLLPIGASLLISLTNWDILTEARFVGLQNYADMLGDKLFRASFRNIFYYTFVSVPASILVPFVLALLMNNKLRGIVFFRACYFLPAITSTVAISTVWYWMYNPDYGLINMAIYQIFGVVGPSWLGSTQWAMPAIIIMSIWKGSGYNMVIFLAALQGVPQELYESARIDGASWWRQLRHITIPMVSPTTFFILIISIISSFQMFEQTYVMTKGGPAYATLSLVFYTYQQAFDYFRMGYASALAWVLFAVIMVFSFIQMAYQKKWVHYN
ncbi:MAG: sugar ABC transporter permease [Clostridiales bacterium]|nr:sugar ABC transporter permease [Clostridiales bacterium]